MRFKLPILLLFSPSIFFSQKKDSSKIKKFQFAFGTEINIFQTLVLNNKWSLINSEISEPHTLDSNYKNSNYSYGNSNVKLNWSFQYKQQIKNSKFQFSPRLSYTFGDGPAANQSWYKTSSFRRDTLTSSQSGEMYFLDSNYYETKNLSLFSKAHHFKLELLLEYEISKQFTLYSGFEFGLLYLVNTQVREYYSSSYKIEEFDSNQTEFGTFSNNNHSITTSSTEFSTPKIKAYSVGIPFGFKFRLSKKENFFNKFLCSYEFNVDHIYYEFGSSFKTKKPQQGHLLRLLYEF